MNQNALQGAWRAGLVVDYLPDRGMHTVVFIPPPETGATVAAVAAVVMEEARDLCLAREEVWVCLFVRMVVGRSHDCQLDKPRHNSPGTMARHRGRPIQAWGHCRRWGTRCGGRCVDGDGAALVRPRRRGHAREGVVEQGPGFLRWHRHGVGWVSFGLGFDFVIVLYGMSVGY